MGGRSFPLMVILTGYLGAVLDALRTSSSVSADLSDPPAPHAVVAVPAHAHAAQRFLTLDAFRRSGFVVTGVLNEPSAAGFEYTHRQARTLSSRRTRVVVFDLGGGTFDASLVAVDDRLSRRAIVVEPRSRHLLLDLSDGGLRFGDPRLERFDARLARLELT